MKKSVVIVFNSDGKSLINKFKFQNKALNRFKPSSKSILLTVPRRCFFCGSFLLVMLHVGACCSL